MTHSPAASTFRRVRLRDGDITTENVHVLCIDSTCARVATSLNRCKYLCPSPKQLPKHYTQETLNPETGTSGAGPGAGPLYHPPATHECETEQTCELHNVWANPTANSKAILVRMAMAPACEI